jgi:hypothetical protein
MDACRPESATTTKPTRESVTIKAPTSASVTTDSGEIMTILLNYTINESAETFAFKWEKPGRYFRQLNGTVKVQRPVNTAYTISVTVDYPDSQTSDTSLVSISTTDGNWTKQEYSIGPRHNKSLDKANEQGETDLETSVLVKNNSAELNFTVLNRNVEKIVVQWQSNATPLTSDHNDTKGSAKKSWHVDNFCAIDLAEILPGTLCSIIIETEKTAGYNTTHEPTPGSVTTRTPTSTPVTTATPTTTTGYLFVCQIYSH